MKFTVLKSQRGVFRNSNRIRSGFDRFAFFVKPDSGKAAYIEVLEPQRDPTDLYLVAAH